jgi:hypothetical protein
MIRDFEPKDWDKIKAIHESNANFPTPDYDSPVMLIKKTVTDDKGNILGSAFLHLTSEVGLILSNNLSNVTRARIISELFNQIYKEFCQTDLEDTHVFITPETDTHYADFLIKHCGFKKDTGLVLYRGKNSE